MDLKELYKKLTESEEFKEWKKKHPKDYLVHFFKFSEEFEGDWQIGYYSKESDKITGFVIGEQIGVLPEENVFKKQGAVKKLVLSKVKISEKEAFESLKKIKEEEYQSKVSLKTIVVLQNLSVGQVWNITFITNDFNTLNFKIGAENGKVLNHELTSLVNFTKK